MNVELLIALCALIVSALSFAVSFFFNHKDHERRRKQATIEYFEGMTANLFETQAKFNNRLSQQDISISDLEKHPDLLKDAINVLSAFERLGVGVNSGVFDFDLVDRMAGSYLIYLLSQFSPYIEIERGDASRTRSYEEFEHLVQRIKDNRKHLANKGKIT